MAGVTLSRVELDCLDRDLSAALGLDYPASWQAYRLAMDAKMSALIATIESMNLDSVPYITNESGIPVPPAIPRDTTHEVAVQHCLDPTHKAQLLSLQLLNGAQKWNEFSGDQQDCLMSAVAPYIADPESAASLDLEQLCKLTSS